MPRLMGRITRRIMSITITTITIIIITITIIAIPMAMNMTMIIIMVMTTRMITATLPATSMPRTGWISARGWPEFMCRD